MHTYIHTHALTHLHLRSYIHLGSSLQIWCSDLYDPLMSRASLSPSTESWLIHIHPSLIQHSWTLLWKFRVSSWCLKPASLFLPLQPYPFSSRLCYIVVVKNKCGKNVNLASPKRRPKNKFTNGRCNYLWSRERGVGDTTIQQDETITGFIMPN